MSRRRLALTGALDYGPDVGPADAAHLVFVRSPVAHAGIVDIATAEAAAMPGVLGVFTAADLELPRYTQVPGLAEEQLQPPLALDDVRYVGQRVAAVVARTLGQALDAVELVDVRYEARAPVLDPSTAPTCAGPWEVGDARTPAVDDVVVAVSLHNPRVSPSPIETTTARAEPDGAGGLTVHAGSQLPAATHRDLCAALGLAPERLRLVGPPMGGAFGAKTVGGSPDLSVLASVALRLGTAVRFVEDRSSHTAVNHARDQHQRWTLTAGPDGGLRHLALDAVADAGAYVATGAFEPATTLMMAAGPYRVGAVHVRTRSVATNTTPTGPYRGPGRAEATAGLERAMDVLAAELGVDPVELRRRNLLRPDELPHQSPCGPTYGVADHLATLEAALGRADVAGWRDEQQRRSAAGHEVRVGVGVATWIDATAGFNPSQQSSLCVEPDGALTLLAGSAPCGQGHEDTFAELIAERLGVGVERVRLADPDSTGPVDSVGSFGSRSGQIVGSAVDAACTRMVEQARLMGAAVLEAAPADVVPFGDGTFGVAGVPDRALSLHELADASRRDGAPPGVQPGLASVGGFSQDERTFPSGCHVAVVEVDTATGGVRLEALVTATDCGTVLHEPDAIGQAQGAMVQGAAQALFEAIEYDDDGNLSTGSLVSYGIPAASELPGLDVMFVPTPTEANPLGAKGLGESGCVGAPAAVHNAVHDALRPFGVDPIDMPCTPERVWRAIRAGQAPAGR